MFGLDWSDPETLWLNVTNVVLGIVTIVALVSVIGAVGVELAGRLKRRFANAVDYHSHHVPELGLTMADGGEPVDGKDDSKKDK